MTDTTQLSDRLAQVRQHLAEACGDRYPLPRLIAVTKTHPVEDFLSLADMGVTDIGENHVQ